MAPYDGGFGPVLPFEQWPNHAEAKSNLPYIKQMIDASDFIGVSNYARLGLSLSFTSSSCHLSYLPYVRITLYRYVG
jgi:hypothetical protein